MLLTDEQLKTLILNAKLVDEKKLNELATVAKTSEAPLADVLVEKDVITDEHLGLMIADFIKFPFVDLSKVFITEEVSNIIPEKMARKYKIIPFTRDNEGIKIAMSDPQNTDIQKMIEKKTGEKVIAFFATERDIYNALHVYRKELQDTFDKLIKEANAAGPTNEAPIAKIVDLIITNAYQDKTSDIHIEAQEKNSLVRFRIDGILHDVLFLPKHLHDQIAARIKVLSRLRTDEHLSPQDGKMRFSMEEEDLDIRVSLLPMVDGEKVVMRLLASKYQQFSLVDLGMNEKDLQKVTNGFSKSYGMILSTGPTGSGKTTSIYSILKILNTREKNITTIEDPVEYKMKGVNQIQVNVKTNLTFASGLRSILRQDPNIVFVGEIRDGETAGIAVNAALTGHLVLSTLHTNDAATTLPRLTDMKVEPFLVASTVNVIVAQRLVRKICEVCKESISVDRKELIKNLSAESVKRHFEEKAEVRLYKGKGCKICHFTGYKGRIGVFEVLEISQKIRELIAKKNDADSIIKQAVNEGMVTMLEDGLEKVARGETTMEEVLRVTKVETL